MARIVHLITKLEKTTPKPKAVYIEQKKATQLGGHSRNYLGFS